MANIRPLEIISIYKCIHYYFSKGNLIFKPPFLCPLITQHFFISRDSILCIGKQFLEDEFVCINKLKINVSVMLFSFASLLYSLNLKYFGYILLFKSDLLETMDHITFTFFQFFLSFLNSFSLSLLLLAIQRGLLLLIFI